MTVRVEELARQIASSEDSLRFGTRQCVIAERSIFRLIRDSIPAWHFNPGETK
jgi:hypothetical protein